MAFPRALSEYDWCCFSSSSLPDLKAPPIPVNRKRPQITSRRKLDRTRSGRLHSHQKIETLPLHLQRPEEGRPLPSQPRDIEKDCLIRTAIPLWRKHVPKIPSPLRQSYVPPLDVLSRLFFLARPLLCILDRSDENSIRNPLKARRRQRKRKVKPRKSSKAYKYIM